MNISNTNICETNICADEKMWDNHLSTHTNVRQRNIYVFQQDCALAHNATKTQKWCQASLSCFWAKGVRPGNSPDLSPIENLSVIVQHKVDKMATATSEVNLIRNVQSASRSTSPETLDSLMCRMLKLMRVCAENPGDYINI